MCISIFSGIWCDYEHHLTCEFCVAEHVQPANINTEKQTKQPNDTNKHKINKTNATNIHVFVFIINKNAKIEKKMKGKRNRKNIKTK